MLSPEPMPVEVTAAVVVAGALDVDAAAVDDAALDMVELMLAFPVSLRVLSAIHGRT